MQSFLVRLLLLHRSPEMCWEGWEEGHSHSLVTRSQSSPHRWARMSGGAGGGPFPSPGQLGVDKPPAG